MTCDYEGCLDPCWKDDRLCEDHWWGLYVRINPILPKTWWFLT